MKLSVEINNTTRQKINVQKIRKMTEHFLRAYRKSGREVSLAVVGAAEMRRLNKKYRGIDKTTDVLSFSSGDSSGKTRRAVKFWGEVIINIQEAKKIGHYRKMLAEIGEQERTDRDGDYIFYFLLVHGLLHLAGYDDKTEKERRVMLVRGKKFLEKAYKVV
ncbi:MAG: rRNA maturation RNase YbeY [Patescibacteria group bacterium]